MPIRRAPLAAACLIAWLSSSPLTAQRHAAPDPDGPRIVYLQTDARSGRERIIFTTPDDPAPPNSRPPGDAETLFLHLFAFHRSGGTQAIHLVDLPDGPPVLDSFHLTRIDGQLTLFRTRIHPHTGRCDAPVPAPDSLATVRPGPPVYPAGSLDATHLDDWVDRIDSYDPPTIRPAPGVDRYHAGRVLTIVFDDWDEPEGNTEHTIELYRVGELTVGWSLDGFHQAGDPVPPTVDWPLSPLPFARAEDQLALLRDFALLNRIEWRGGTAFPGCQHGDLWERRDPIIFQPFTDDDTGQPRASVHLGTFLDHSLFGGPILHLPAGNTTNPGWG